MILTFTQGIVTHSTSTGDVGDTPTFLVIEDTGAKVDLNAPINQMFQQAFAQRDANYLLTVREDGPVSAWGYNGDLGDENVAMVNGEGGGDAGNIFYLFIDLDKSTGTTAYGYSITEPATDNENNPPNKNNAAERPDGQHWFNTTDNTMNRWRANGVAPNYGTWVEKVRCFVAKYTFNVSFESMSNNTPSFIGTTVGLDNGTYRVGSLIFDLNYNVVKRTNNNNINVFFTTEDIFGSGLPTSSRTRLESFVVDGVAQHTVTAYQAVYFSKLNEVKLLTTDAQDDSIFGILEEGALAGQLAKVTTSGVINNSAWRWQDVNQQIFVDKDQPGILTSVEDGYVTAPNQKPIAVAIDETTILLRSSELVLTSNTAGSGVSDFLSLEDTPDAYSGQAGKFVQVNDTENELEFNDYVMSNLDDVDTASIAIGNALIYEGGTPKWTARFLIESDIVGLTATLSNKSDVGHTHVEANITDLDKYTQLEVDDLLDLKSDVGHTHTLGSLSDVDFVGSPEAAEDGDVLTYVSGSPSTWQALTPAASGEVNTSSNLGTTGSPAGVGIAAAKNGVDLPFKSLVEGTNVTLVADADTITISAAGGGGGSASRINDVQDDTFVETDSVGDGSGNTITMRTGTSTNHTAADQVFIDEDGFSIIGLNGAPGPTSGTGGDFVVDAGDGKNAQLAPGPYPAAFGGRIDLFAGDGGDGVDGGHTTGGSGGYMRVTAGDAGRTRAGGSSRDGGQIIITAGQGSARDDYLVSNGGSGGRIEIIAGAGGYGRGAGGDVTIIGGQSDPGDYGGNGTNTGGDVKITGGDTSTGGTGLGGSIELRAGRAAYSGAGDGAIKIRTSESNNASKLQFFGNNDSNYVSLVAPSGQASDVSFVLPGADGANGEVLTTDGSGNLSFAAGGGGAVPYDLVFQGLSTLGTSVPIIVGQVVASRAFTVELTGHQAYAETGPTGSDAVFTVYHYDGTTKTALGTVTFTAAVGSPPTGSPPGGDNQFVSFSLTGSPAVTVAVGDVLSMEMTTADSANIMADVTFTLLATA